MLRAVALFALTAVVGCSASDELAKMPGNFEDCTDNSVTFTFGVEPLTLVRNADVSLSVRWETFASLNDPVATLRVGDGPVVEVEVPLLPEADGVAGHAYQGSLLNPFGMGAPAGTVEVLAAASANEGCSTSPTAATAFELE